MKSFLKVLGLLLVVAIIIIGVYVYKLGWYDTRFWKNDEKVYTPFYNGVYMAGIDLVPGAYDVEVRGKTGGPFNTIRYFSIDTNEETNYVSIEKGSNGFHFTLNNGEYIEVDIVCNEMRIKKAS